MKRLVGLVFLCGLPACFAVTDLDRFEGAATRAPGNYVDLQATWTGMDNHKAEFVEFKVVDASNIIQTRGIFRPLGSADVTFLVPMGVPRQNGPFQLDIWADHNRSGGYDFVAGGTADHSWRLPLASALGAAGDAYRVDFQHNYSFNDLSSPPVMAIGQPVKVTLSDMTAFLGQRIELRVADANSGHTVAFYRVAALERLVELEVPGMIEGGSRYTATLYLDDGNGSGVRGFTRTVVAEEEGLVLSGADPLSAGFTEITDKNAIVPP